MVYLVSLEKGVQLDQWEPQAGMDYRVLLVKGECLEMLVKGVHLAGTEPLDKEDLLDQLVLTDGQGLLALKVLLD